MENIRINSLNYYKAEDIIKNAPIYSKSSRNGKELIKKKNIDVKSFTYARQVNSIWTKSDGTSNKFDKVFIRRKYVDELIELQNELNGENVSDENGTEKAPDILSLEDNEKFHDELGNVLEIETRGVRQYDGIYFKVKDVANVFDLLKLSDTISDKRGSYVLSDDYNYFICNRPVSNGTIANKNITGKELFLTYAGILRVLFVSRSGKANLFVKWATETLFTVQIGTNEQQNKLVAKILGTNVENIVEVFNANANTVPVVYLFSLGYVKDLRKSMNIPASYKDNMIVSIYGRTDNITRRTKEHNTYYKKLKGVQLRLKYYSYVDPQHLSKAEKYISDYVDDINCRFGYEKEEEMLIIDEKQIKRFESQFECVSKKYMGHITDMVNKIKELERELEIVDLKYQNQLLTNQVEILNLKNEVVNLKKK
jgi:hypothetical protein